MGGAFVLAALVWTSLRYKLVVDRTPAAPTDAVLAATIFDRQSADWLSFEAHLPEKARQALSLAGDMGPVTLFAVPGNDAELDWGLLEASSTEAEGTGRREIRLVPKWTSAIGYLALNGRAVPFEVKITSGIIQARVGRDFRGPSFKMNPFTKGRRLLAPLYMQSAYLEKPSGVSWDTAAGLLGPQLQRFQPQTWLWRLPGRLELSVSASETQELNPFILYYRPEYGTDLAGPSLETYAKALLAESDPIGFEVTLPDDTVMTELRRDPDSVLTARKKVGQFGELAQMKAPGGTQKMDIFYANDGEAWLSDDFGLIQASIMGGVGAKRPFEACEVGGTAGFAAFSGKSLENWPYFRGMERLTFSIHSLESGVFTMCGYFTP